MSPVLSVENIFFSVEEISLSGKRKIILEDISFDIFPGKIYGIAGESGSGKTTLAKILAGILTPAKGNIILNIPGNEGKINSKKRINPVQILFQNNGEILNPFRVVGNVIEEALKIRHYKGININEEMKNIFDSVNFPTSLWNKKGFELSGGEQQRAALARLLAVKPEILILDEPFSAQDPESQLNLLKLFKEINKKFNLIIICISHNLKILRELTEEVIILYQGKMAEKGETGKILNSPGHPYTKFLLKAENYDLKYEEFISYNKD